MPIDGGYSVTREVAAYQVEVASGLSRSFRDSVPVQRGWRAFREQGRRLYSPIVDIAVGPFAVNERLGEEYDRLAQDYEVLINIWIGMFVENWNRYTERRYFRTRVETPQALNVFVGSAANWNARCFVAIEIENQTTRKHLMGSIVNAGALGRVGLLVAWRDDVLRAAIRMREYFDFLREVAKRTFDMRGVLVPTREQLVASLRTHHTT